MKLFIHETWIWTSSDTNIKFHFFIIINNLNYTVRLCSQNSEWNSMYIITGSNVSINPLRIYLYTSIIIPEVFHWNKWYGNGTWYGPVGYPHKTILYMPGILEITAQLTAITTAHIIIDSRFYHYRFMSYHYTSIR